MTTYVSPTWPLAFVVLLIMGLTACRNEAPRDEAGADGSAPPADSFAAQRSIIPADLAPGDSLLGLRVEALQVKPETIDSFGWMGRVRFSGTLTLSGTYAPHPAYPEVEQLCFFPDDDAAVRLPRFPNDERISWFCFSNQDQARQRLAAPPAEGAATIMIDGFEYLYEHSDTYNSARLERVVNAS